jgi:hypothetical protein
VRIIGLILLTSVWACAAHISPFAIDSDSCDPPIVYARAWPTGAEASVAVYDPLCPASVIASWEGVLELNFTGGTGDGLFIVCITAFADYYFPDGSGASSGRVGPWERAIGENCGKAIARA